MSSIQLKQLFSDLSSKLNLYSGVHFLDSTRLKAFKSRKSISFSTNEITELAPFRNIYATNSKGVGFTDSGTTMYPTTLIFESGDAISLPVGIGKQTIKQ
jgi:hypothetical protein